MKTAEHIIETVDKLVRKYHTRDPYELCQLLGIKIHYYDLQKKLKGFFYYQSRQKNIVIDHNVNGILERILVAHELGHAVLHTKIAMMHGFQEMEVFDDRSIEENEANFFAAELLLEDGKVLECLSEHTFFETAKALCAVRIVIKPWGTGIVRMEQALFGVVTTILVLYSLLVLSWILWSV